jgi:tetratricopeptide (TPR) repeat protein
VGAGEFKQKDLEARAKIAAQVATVSGAAAVASIAELLPDWMLTTAGLLALAAGIAALLFYIEARQAGTELVVAEQERARLAHEVAVDAALRTPVCSLGELKLSAVGVDPVDPRVLEQALKVEGNQLAYVRRDVDERLRAHLVRAGDGSGPVLVCLHGPSKAGKSRSILAALKRELPDALLVAPDRTRANLQTILDHRELQRMAQGGDRRIVLWLDDLEGFVRLGDHGLDKRRLEDLESEVRGLVVAATSGGRGLIAHGDEERSRLQQPLGELLDAGVREPLLAGLSAGERAGLADVVPADLASEMSAGLGEVAVSGRKLVEILVNESHPGVSAGRPCPEGAALAWAAITAFRLGATDPLSDELLRVLFECYASSVSDEVFGVALAWATAPLYARVGLLRRSDDGLVVPYDYLVQYAPGREDHAERCAWTLLLRRGTPDTQLQLGIAAYNRTRHDDAEDAFRRAAERGHAAGASNLGVLLMLRGKLAEAEVAYRRADERGDALGAFNLGLLLEERGELADAEAAYRRASERGYAAGTANLGVLLKQRGELADAEAAYRRADERGDATGAYNLGVLLEEGGKLADAEAAYRRADERGHAAGTANLGVLLQERGEVAEAEVAYRHADERGDALGAFNLGLLLEERGEVADAEAAYRRASERGYAAGAFNLGVLLQERGEVADAEAAYRRASERGVTAGAYNLGVLHKERGELAEAEAAWRSADEGGYAAGAFNLGVLLQERGEVANAEAAYRRASERGYAAGAFNLGVLLKNRGELADAQAAWRRALRSSDRDIAARARDALAHLDD